MFLLFSVIENLDFERFFLLLLTTIFVSLLKKKKPIGQTLKRVMVMTIAKEEGARD